MKLKRGYYDVFVRSCAKNSSRIAVRYYDGDVYKNYTYSELYGVCEYISQNLRQLKCNKGVIGLVSGRNIIIPCVIAAAHKWCTTFMFLDPGKDIKDVAGNIKFTIIITIDNNLNTTLSGLCNRKPDRTISVFDLTINFYTSELQPNFKYIEQYSFIALTSGSTGDPKHIQVPIQCIQPNIDDLTKIFDITPEDIIYFTTPLTFDPSMVEILLACMNGASLLIAPEKADILFPENKENSVSFWQTTPSIFFQYSDADIKNKILSSNSTLKILALGGEPLTGVKRLKELKHQGNDTKIFTLYGVTEMSCWACVAELNLNIILTDKDVPLGKCLSETELYINPTKLSNNNEGNIILVSKTRKCIVLNKPIRNDEECSLNLVDTGDMGQNRNGTIYYSGRKDDIIKRFGNKVNLQSIESTIMQCPRVKTCSCIWLPKPMLLVVYYCSESLSSQELSDYLKCKLDEKHWPDKLIKVNSLPTNSHGKMSKLILSKMFYSDDDEMSCNIQTIDYLQQIFFNELKSIMNNNHLMYEDIKNKDFFSIGGTSFLAVTMCNKLSLGCPQFAKFILPYLMSQNTIGDIIQLAHNELHSQEVKPKKIMKRTRPNSHSYSESKVNKKVNIENTNKFVEFLIQWTYDMGKCVDASPTLYQTGSNLYVTVGSHSGKIIVMDAISGTLQGMISLKSRVEASVLCYQDIDTDVPYGVVGAYDGTVVCFMLENCQEIWKINVGSMIKSKATCCSGYLYIASYDGNVRRCDIKTGIMKDSIRITDQGISADLVLGKNEYVLVGTLSGVCASIHTQTNSIAWRGTLESPIFAAPVLYDNDKFVIFAEVNGLIHCRTVEKGIKIWKYQGAAGNIFSSFYVKEVNKLIWQIVFGCHDNKVYCINVKNFQPSLHWKASLSSPVYSTPCGLSNKLLLAASNNGKLYVINSDNGIIVAEYHLPGEAFSSPSVYGDCIFIGCRNDYLYSLKYVPNL